MNASPTHKQQVMRAAMQEHPRRDGESVGAWCRRIAPLAGVSWNYVQHIITMDKNAAIGAAILAREKAEEAKLKCQVAPFTGNVGPVTDFRGWAEFFSKVKILAETYLLLAQERGDVYATAFLKDIRDVSDRAQNRAVMSKYG